MLDTPLQDKLTLFAYKARFFKSREQKETSKMNWRSLKEIRLLLTTLPERLVWGILVSSVIIILVIITKLNPPLPVAGHLPITQTSGRITPS